MIATGNYSYFNSLRGAPRSLVRNDMFFDTLRTVRGHRPFIN